MAMVKLMPDGTVIKKPEAPGKEHRILVNPEMPIPLESSLVHGVYDEDVADAPTFGRIAPGLLKWLHGCDLGGFNSNRFDVPMLAEEFLRVGIDFGLEGRHLVDVQNIFHKMEQRTLRAAYHARNGGCILGSIGTVQRPHGAQQPWRDRGACALGG